jgi:hypothetical protein
MGFGERVVRGDWGVAFIACDAMWQERSGLSRYCSEYLLKDFEDGERYVVGELSCTRRRH